jgi:2-hydroxychromene-2-carboxylate isomerase
MEAPVAYTAGTSLPLEFRVGDTRREGTDLFCRIRSVPFFTVPFFTVMNTPIEFWFEFASTYSFPAAMRIEDVARTHGRRIVWRPFLLGPIFRAQGWNDSPFNLYPAKGRYMWRDMERICAQLRVPFRKPSQFPRNGLLSARIVAAFDGAQWMPQFVRKVYLANFAEDRDISAADVLHSCLRDLVPDPAAVLSAASSEDAKSRLRSNTERATALGIFGAPTFVVGEELFWGNDRLEAALEFAAGRDGSILQ